MFSISYTATNATKVSITSSGPDNYSSSASFSSASQSGAFTDVTYTCASPATAETYTLTATGAGGTATYTLPVTGTND
jgi:hypothetical protein